MLHKLYLLLRSFFKEKRGMKMAMAWEDDLGEGEKELIQKLQELYSKEYGQDSISKAHARELLEGAEKIIKGG